MNEDILDFLNDEKYLAHLWACELFKNSNDWIVLDTETTGLNYKDEIIDIAIVSRYGAVIFDSLIKPTCDISEGAAKIHGITKDLVKDAPTFPQIYSDLVSALENKKVIIYNKNFDTNKIEDMCELYELPEINYEAECAMQQYAKYYGEWSEYWENFKWQKLEGGNHRARGDALATFNLLKKMAKPLKCDIFWQQILLVNNRERRKLVRRNNEDICYYELPLFPPIQIVVTWETYATLALFGKGSKSKELKNRKRIFEIDFNLPKWQIYR